MTQPTQSEQTATPKRRRGGAPKPYPTIGIEDALVLAKTIVNDGVGDQMRRLTLFDNLGKSPDSGPSRTLVVASSRYGLTTGSYSAEYLTVTDDGKAIAAKLPSLSGVRERAFDRAIGSIVPFAKLYTNLKNQRVPSKAVLRDEVTKVGIQASDAEVAGSVFLANVRYLGLIQEVSGSERLISIEQVLEDAAEHAEFSPASPNGEVAKPGSAPPIPGLAQQTVPDPSMHIDIQNSHRFNRKCQPDRQDFLEHG